MQDSENPPALKSSTVFLRNFAKNWVRTALLLVVLFSAIYFMLWKNFCPNGKDCNIAFTYVREIFGKMLLIGAAIVALGGWGIFRAYNRMK